VSFYLFEVVSKIRPSRTICTAKAAHTDTRQPRTANGLLRLVPDGDVKASISRFGTDGTSESSTRRIVSR